MSVSRLEFPLFLVLVKCVRVRVSLDVDVSVSRIVLQQAMTRFAKTLVVLRMKCLQS